MKTTNILGKLSPADMPMADTLQCGMTTAFYEAPVTTRTVVETEGSFCGSIIDDTNSSSDVNTTNQQVQNDYYEPTGDGSSKNPFDFSETDKWD